HAGNDDHGRGAVEQGQFFGEAMGTGDANVLDKNGLNSHPTQRLARFLGNGQVGGAGSDDGDKRLIQDFGFKVLDFRLSQWQSPGPRYFVVASRGEFLDKLRSEAW